MKDFLFLNNNETKDYFLQYRDNLGTDIFQDKRGRWITFKIALNLFLQRGGGNIVETGCQREKNDWGAGASTTIFEEFLQKYDCGYLYSIDNNQEHIDRAKSYLKYPTKTRFIKGDSVRRLTNFERNIDLLYLDSMDYPIDALLQLYPDKTYQGILVQLEKLTEKEVLELIGDSLKYAQKHCLKELEAAYPYLSSLVLIDDNTLPGGGKGRLTREFLLDHGWELILDYHQTLWSRNL